MRASARSCGLLTRFAGADGFSALLRRAIALSSADAPSVQGLEVSVEGSIVGLETVGDEATGEIIAQLLGLLVTFIGEPLTMRLVREAWPDAPDRFWKIRGIFMRKRERDKPHEKVKMQQLPTGVPGLDEILGGGLPEYSLNIIAGEPDSGMFVR